MNTSSPLGTRRPRVGIIGAGRVGAALGAALRRAGYPLVGASGRSTESRARLAALLSGIPVRRGHDVARRADLLIVAVPDDALGPLIADLAESGALRTGQVVAHTSGAHGVGILHPATARGALPLALHPAMTFTGQAADVDRLLAGVSFGITAPAPLRALATRIVDDLGGTVEWVAEADRPLYHAALAHAANHLVTLINEAADLLREAGIAQPQQVLRPLVSAALANALAMGDEALTGPVVRGDATTVATHVETLRRAAPESLPVYTALARRSADRAIASGRLTAGQAVPLLDALADRAPARRRASA